MREECEESKKYCGIRRHTKSLKIEYPDLTLIKYPGIFRCNNCDTVYMYEVVNQQLLYKIRNRSNEHISEIEHSEKQVSSTETKEVRIK